MDNNLPKFVKINFYTRQDNTYYYAGFKFINVNNIIYFGETAATRGEKINGYETRDRKQMTKFDIYTVAVGDTSEFYIDSLSYDLIVDALGLE